MGAGIRDVAGFPAINLLVFVAALELYEGVVEGAVLAVHRGRDAMLLESHDPRLAGELAALVGILTPPPKGATLSAYRTLGCRKKGRIFLGRFLSSFMRLETRSSSWDWLEGTP